MDLSTKIVSLHPIEITNIKMLIFNNKVRFKVLLYRPFSQTK
jgi:hypothetical protein